MPNKILWEADYTSQGNVMTDTELSALANGAVSVVSPAYDNSTKCDQYGQFRLDVDFVAAPSTAGFVSIYAVLSFDGGVTYNTSTTTVADLGSMFFLTTIGLPASTAAIKIPSSSFRLPPGLMKFVAYNASGQVFPTTASTVLKLFTNNDEIQ